MSPFCHILDVQAIIKHKRNLVKKGSKMKEQNCVEYSYKKYCAECQAIYCYAQTKICVHYFSPVPIYK